MNRSPGATYRSAGVDYDELDEGKRQAVASAQATSQLLTPHGGTALDESRGEPAFVYRVGDQTFAFVLEGLGTKSIIARQVYEDLEVNRFADVAYDTVAAIVNDLCCVGARPLVINAYFATGASDWYADSERQAALLDGWRRACMDAGATWGGGESPTLPELVDPSDIELAGSATGLIPPGVDPILGQKLGPGDEIVFVESTGLHANGASLARMIADPDQLPEVPAGYATPLPGGQTFGEALLEPAPLYAPLVADLIDAEVPLHYVSHITGHGMLKLMRANRELTYVIEELPDVPEVLDFMVATAGMSPEAAYSTFNMGCGLAIYTAHRHSAAVIDAAQASGLSAYRAGTVEKGPRRVILRPEDITYESDRLDLNGRTNGKAA